MYIIRNLLLYIINAKHCISSARRKKYTLTRDNIQPPGLMICTALRALMIYQLCELDKKSRIEAMRLFGGPSGTRTPDRPVILPARPPLSRRHFVLCCATRNACGAICACLACASTDSLTLDYVACGSTGRTIARALRALRQQKEATTRAASFCWWTN